jgi:hypothetical protein
MSWPADVDAGNGLPDKQSTAKLYAFYGVKTDAMKEKRTVLRLFLTDLGLATCYAFYR